MTKGFEMKEITGPEERAGICDAILRSLPDWFGNEAAIVDYVRQVRDLPFWAAFDRGGAVGFAALKTHNPYTAEVCVMGIRSEYHRHGAGRDLIGRCEAYCVEQGIEYLTVKTLDESREDEGYAGTRRFYRTMGFRPLEVFPTLWNEANPCLFLAKYLKTGETQS